MRHAIAVLITLTLVTTAAADTLPLDPERAVELALGASDRAGAAAARVDAADERVDAADARRMPTLDLEASVAHRNPVPSVAFPADVPGVGGFVLFPNIQDVYRAGVVLSQPLWTGGAISGGRETARHEAVAATEEADRVDADLRFEARSAYWRAVSAGAALDAARAESERAARLLEDARALRAAGMAVRSDELGAESRVASAQVRVIETDAELANRLAELRSLLGIPPGTELELTERGERLPAAPPAVAPLIDEAMAGRPEIAALEARRDAVASRATTAKAPTRPRVSLAAEWNVARPNERFLPLEDTWNSSWSVGLVAGWRVFDGSRTRSEVASLDAERAALDADLGELERRVALDVETARQTLQAAIAADASAIAAVTAATAREADSRDRYTAGLATVTEVLDAQTDLADAELTLVRARTAAWLADTVLKRAIGR